MKKTPTLTILVGCPASGKSTFAEWKVRTEAKTMRISRDEIRFSQFQEVMDPSVESVILDTCNAKAEYLKQPVIEFSEMANIEFKMFDLPLEELLPEMIKEIEKYQER